MRYLIQQSSMHLLWLDGYGGGIDWEWTADRKTAWRLWKVEADHRLKLVRNQFPDAILIEA